MSAATLARTLTKPFAKSWSRGPQIPGIEAMDAIRGKITRHQMNAAIPERRYATEDISGVIERVTTFGNRQVYSRNSKEAGTVG